jgi:AcrR family transcriptional regulator
VSISQIFVYSGFSYLLSDSSMATTKTALVTTIPEATRNRIFAGVIECVERWGIEKTTLNDIAKAAGCSRQTVYNYYSSKAEVLEAALEEAGQTFMERAEQHVLQFEDSGACLLEAVVFTITNLPREPYLKVLVDAHFLEVFSTFYSSEVSQRRIVQVTRVCLRNSPELLLHCEEIGEITSRFIFSLITTPGPMMRTEDELREFLRRRMLPGLLQS